MRNDWVIVDRPDNNWCPVHVKHLPTYHAKLTVPHDTDYRDLAALDLPRCRAMYGKKRVRTLQDISEWVRARPDTNLAYACCTQAALYEPFKMIHDRFGGNGQHHVCCGDAPHEVRLDGDIVSWQVYFDLFDSELASQCSFCSVVRFNVRTATFSSDTTILS